MRSLKIEKHFSNRTDLWNPRVSPEHKYGFFHDDFMYYSGKSFWKFSRLLQVLTSEIGIKCISKRQSVTH